MAASENLTPFIINHVFMPPKLPQSEDDDPEHTLCESIHKAAGEFSNYLSAKDRQLWNPVVKLLKNFCKAHRSSQLSEEVVAKLMKDMHSGDTLALHVHTQNAGVIIRKEAKTVIIESFEVSASNKAVIQAKGKLLRSFPEPAVQIPTEVFEDTEFQAEFSSFLAQMDADALDSTPTVWKAGSMLTEVRDTPHPRYITQLLTEILRGMGDAAEVPRITKRIADDVLWLNAYKPWRRSPAWLVLRVALQTTLARQSVGHQRYKWFMLFIHAKLLELGLQPELDQQPELDMPTHLIDCMQKKTARRLSKLHPTPPPPSLLVKYVNGALDRAETALKKRWGKAQTEQATTLNSEWTPEGLEPKADTALTLHKSKVHLLWSLEDAAGRVTSRAFKPNHSRRLQSMESFVNTSNWSEIAFSSDDYVIELADFERAVLKDTSAFHRMDPGESCSTIAIFMEKYMDAASTAYKSDPELRSIMILTLFKLWVELDSIVVSECPLLADYSPEIPSTLFHPLLLHTAESIEAMEYVERYAEARRARAIANRSVFTRRATKTCFAVRYFDSNTEMQALKDKIEKAATQQKVKKFQELRELKAIYNEIKKSSNARKCEYVIKSAPRGRSKSYHSERCKKCEEDYQADELEIEIHEWPLPEDPLEVKIVIFELKPPLPFRIWRDITYMLLQDVCTPNSVESLDKPLHMQLFSYPAFKSYNVEYGWAPTQRIILASTTKSIMRSHYRAKKVAEAAVQNVCVNHGPKWSLFDKTKHVWATSKVGNCNIIKDCTFILPQGPYRNLQYAVSGTSHSFNDVIADQAQYSPELSLHEYASFARIRSGPRLQWLNIISELRSGSLDFAEQAVYTLLRQTAWQIGPSSPAGGREWHIEPSQTHFSMVLLAELDDLLLRLRANRHNIIGMQIITVLVSRLLVSATDSQVIEGSLRLMRDVRNVTYEWLKEMLLKLRDIEDESRLQEFKMQVCEMAMTCRGTYDTNLDNIPALLSDNEAVAILIHCAIVVRYNSPPTISKKNIRVRNLRHRDLRLAHLIEPLLFLRISQQPQGLDESILRVWEFYRPSGKWERLQAPNDRWMLTHTAPLQNQTSQCVHLDLLSGQLLVEGKPLGRLPQNMASHRTYLRIFGKRILDVIPADMSDMEFKATSRVGPSCYEVFFALHDDSRLVIRTQRDKEILELVPHEVFEGDLPALLVDDQTHWLNVSTLRGDIEVRDLKTQWEPSPNNWRIQFSSSGRSEMCLKLKDDLETLKLIDPRSETMSIISKQLQPLEEPEWLLVTYSSSTGELVASLPRFQLEFRLINQPKPHLECVNLPGMIIDSDQSSGTLIGLKSQLVLRSKDSILRQIIIPYSPDCEFRSATSNNHTTFTLSVPRQRSLRYFKYTINSTLGRVEGDGSMLSRLYQIYLHALTSYCLPDPLTGCTGTEEALNQLGSARMLSFQKLGDTEHKMLLYISGLTPTRTFYPPHLQEMQSVGWSEDISPLSQHYDFYRLTDSILRYAETLTVFSPQDAKRRMSSLQGSDHLLDRAACRNAIYYRIQTIDSKALSSSQHDVQYASRGSVVYGQRENEGVVFDTSSMVFNWTSRLCTDTQLYKTLEQCGSISGTSEGVQLAYSKIWLEQEKDKFFLSACNACRTASRKKHQYQMVFSFSACVFKSADIRPLIPTILAFATVPRLRVMEPPAVPSYDLFEGLEAKEDRLLEITQRWVKEFKDDAETSLEEAEQKLSAYKSHLSSNTKHLIGDLMGQWPCETPNIPTTYKGLFHIEELEKEAATLFQTWWQNKELFCYIQEVQDILDDVRSLLPIRAITVYTIPPSQIILRPASNHMSLGGLLHKRPAPNVSSPPSPLRGTLPIARSAIVHQTNRLEELLQKLRNGTFLSRRSEKPTEIQTRYADDLRQSLESFKREIQRTTGRRGTSTSQVGEMIRHYHDQCQKHLVATHQLIQDRLLPSTQAERGLLTAGLWPCITLRSLLSVLGSTSNALKDTTWRQTLNGLARALLGFQHACRLLNHLSDENMEELFSELEDTVIEAEPDHDEHYSTRLLIQVDGDFLSRSIQVDFTREMTAPSSKSNSVFQLNMGEGKSSVIVPLVAATLSDGNKLVRVIVLKPLAPAMFQLLVHRLGGLANRRIFYLPFSRSPRITMDQAQQAQDLFLTCAAARGVLVVQPEHILSFKLMGLDRMFHSSLSASPTDPDVIRHLLESQKWLDENSRDILDESDEILHVKYQLVYTVGQQQYLDGSPDRWTIIQQVLGLVKKHAPIVKQSFKDSFELLDDDSGSYPHVRILEDKAGERLIQIVAKAIAGGALEQCSFDLFPLSMRSLALSYITTLNFNTQDIHALEEYCEKSEAWNTLLTLRGLLAHGTLQFVLKEKRWRVDYGHDLSRSLLAVPYRAKDVPSLRSEFSHPDVAILLTCLSYYWQGLSEAQSEQCFNYLLKQDNPSQQYDRWISQSRNIPPEFQHLSSIDIFDFDQRSKLHNLFHRKQAFIDFYLSNVVFPRDAKEFPKKMATSGWDLAECKPHVTTGFSGTKDGRYLLPGSIEQADPLFQSSTNAKVLMYLLQSENNYYRCIDQMVQANAEQSFLHLLNDLKPEIRVLLDVGAQILKLSNEEVAAEWLDSNSNPGVIAIVYFDTDDEIQVRGRNGEVEPFVSSPFRQQMDKCLLYLDDVHTRGTDFKLPSGTRAAVTLGPKVTKDRLVQGCMRMRNLGRGHSVMFFAPYEVDRAIRKAASLKRGDNIQVKDILLWTMFESCSEVTHRISQWAQQGIDHRKREKAWMEFKKSEFMSDSLQSAWVQREARSLEEMYAGGPGGPLVADATQVGDCADILWRYQKWSHSSVADSRFQEEQEREVIHEIEIERQLKRPPKVHPAIPHLHDDVCALVQTGVLKSSSDAFLPLFQALDGVLFEEQAWASQDLFSTRDFCTTVQSFVSGDSSDYFCPVHWILSTVPSSASPIFVVLSAYEVNNLLPDIRRSDKVILHLYAPRVMKTMKSFENLAFHCIPPLTQAWGGPPTTVITRLNLWAGQLYLADEKMYQHLCQYLGLYSQEPCKKDIIQPDGFIKREHRRGLLLLTCPFKESPLPYLKKLFASRRKGRDFTSTHMGKILRARLLTKKDFSEG
ncbi:hypothetical protein FRC02_011119 [Tulasnella sp. 418]|nr:hypothetical protein FRC02_011119 [Tulasnella sp. 418]